jgi:hypothetical protein
MSAISPAPKKYRPVIKHDIIKYCANHNICNKDNLSKYEKEKGKRIDVLLKEHNADLFNPYSQSDIRLKVSECLKKINSSSGEMNNAVEEDPEQLSELNSFVPNNNQPLCPLVNDDLEVQETIQEPIIISAVQEQTQEISSESEEKEEQQVAKTFDEFVAENKALKKSLKKLCHRIDDLTGVVQRLSEPNPSACVEIILAVESEKDTQSNKPQQIMHILSAILIIMFIFCNMFI